MGPNLLIILWFSVTASAVEPNHAPRERAGQTPSTIAALELWLQQAPPSRPAIADQEFAHNPLSQKEARQCRELLWQDLVVRLRKERTAEWEAKKITLGNLTMRFDYRVFGERPKGGRSLYLSLHGGGGAAAAVNEKQWENQIGLYQPAEGIYLAPRAPTNDWNLWHQPHIDDFFDRLIVNAVILADVNPDRVYLMGYSAGGDGVFQLAPRMAGRFAAAAMMAGHPNETSPLGLRNLPFAIYMGGKDGAYNRNNIALQWKSTLATLRRDDPQGYLHQVNIYPEMGHWMQHKDRGAVDWLTSFTRNPYPEKIVWKQDNVTHRRFYWLAVPEQEKKTGAEMVVLRDGQSITIQRADPITKVIIYLNDEMVQLDKPVTVRWGDKEVFNHTAARRVITLVQTLQQRMDKALMFSAVVELSLPE
jgi:hypothetical protein